MKFQTIKIAVSLVFVFPALVYAAPCYGPNIPVKGSWDIGVQAHLLLNRDMEKDYGQLKGSHYSVSYTHLTLPTKRIV